MNRFYKQLPYSVFNNIVRSAKRKNIVFNITIEYIYDLFLKQNRRCYLTGIKLILPKNNRDKSATASLDRINSQKGYIKGNLGWCHKEINMMKHTRNKEEFIKFCKLVAENN